jgi:hypothetical protein
MLTLFRAVGLGKSLHHHRYFVDSKTGRTVSVKVVKEPMETPISSAPSILHICTRETIRPLRDQVLRLSGFQVDSTLDHTEGLSMFRSGDYDLVLIDVEGEEGIPRAERMCSDIKTAQQQQLVAFVCNWRVAILTDCPDEIVRTEFDPAAFARGVSEIIPPTSNVNSN